MSFGITTRNGVSLGLGTTPSLAKVPPYATLRLNFAQANALDSILTFTRASSQTYFDSTGTLQTATTNVAAFDYNPTTLVPLGLSMWEARTNSIRNNTMVGAAAGTPGTPPTNWSISVPAGITRTISNVTTTNGISTFDVRFSGTTGGVGGIEIKPDGNASSITGAVAAQSWTQSAWLALTAGSLTNISGQRLVINEYSAGPTYLRTGVCATSVLAAGATLTRVSGTLVLGASTTILEPIIILDIASGVAIDITLRIGMPQLELGAFATPVISTTAAAATRAAPACSTTNLGWYNATEGTFVAAATLGTTVAGSRSAFDITDGTTNNRIIARFNNGASQIATTICSGAATVAALTSTVSPAASLKTEAVAYRLNDFALSVSSETAVVDTSGAVPVSPTQIHVGSDIGLTEYINGWIASLTYYPLRLPNATLQALST